MIGRLFRSKTTVREKRNLLIFVTARLIDPAGNPIHREDSASLR
jgi:type II secretory pathway component GspD/PulD (secretin)